jgi:hypothetical protein
LLANLSDQDIIRKLEDKFSRDLTHIVPAPEAFDRRHNQKGDRVFRCLDIEAESILTVDTDGYVKSRLVNSKYADILGTIK